MLRRRPVSLIAGVASLAVIAGLWGARRPIATELIDHKLAEWHVPARYRIATLGLTRQRLIDVVLGDPMQPDLVADWIELDTHFGLDGAHVVGVRAGHLRLRGRIANGRLTLGSVDRLIPAAPGKPFALPAIDLDLGDGGLDLTTPAGPVVLRLAGRGRLDSGFRGTLRGQAPTLALQGCAASAVTLAGTIDTRATGLRLTGPIRADRLECGGVRASGVRFDQATTLSPALDHWRGTGRMRADRVARGGTIATGVEGGIGFDGGPLATTGRLTMAAARIAASDLVSVRGATLAGDYRLANNALRFNGTVGGRATLADRWRRGVARLDGQVAGTPVAPLIARLGPAVARASADTAFTASIAIDAAAHAGRATLNRLAAQSQDGARATFDGGRGIVVNFANGATTGDGIATISGGGLPDVALRIASTADGTISAVGRMARYAAGGAALALDNVSIASRAGADVRVAGLARFSGPVAGGDVQGATLPLAATWDGRRLAVNARCVPVGAEQVKLASLALVSPRLSLCPIGGAMISFANGRIGGGIRTGAINLNGHWGSGDLALRAAAARATMTDGHFGATSVAVRIGGSGGTTAIAAATLDGAYRNGRAAGHFTGGHGQIGHVPIDLSAADGDWSWHDNRLVATGKLTVADAAPSPRYVPLIARGVTLTIADDRLTATGNLVHPASGTVISNVTIDHDFGSGDGKAELAVPDLAFGKGFQPDDLTPLAKGVVANVAATITGEGHIRWTPDAVTSDGDFATKGADLAALFGPVSGLSTRIHFTDLLNLESAPDQTATVASINTGVVVENGTVRYRLLSGERVDVASADWPFAGGTLHLQPTLLDFTENHERHLTFQMTGVDAAQFLLQFNFSNLNATGIFDGTLPMVFDAHGGRIENGHLAARP
ncbi:MAG: intermembrane phospholipid transport protein YdbH family protein, partial [Sphingomonas sp.]